MDDMSLFSITQGT